MQGPVARPANAAADGRDAHGRIHPGSQPGWGISWWTYGDGGYTRESWLAAPASERLDAQFRYWEAVRDGWEPPVPKAAWTPHHPWGSEA